MRNYDLEFLKKFSVMIGLLALLALGLLIGSWVIHKGQPIELPDNVARNTQARIAPVGAVYAGSTGAAAQAAAAAAATAAATANVAYDGTLDGSVIFNNLCGSCHTSGVGGAPTMATADWTARIAQGADTLHTHAIEGFTGNTGIMPAKGGNPSLTDEQVIAAVDWMVDNLE